MKTTTYSITEKDFILISQDHKNTFKSLFSAYCKSTRNYRFENEIDAKLHFESLASVKACFGQLVRDGLASINKIEDDTYTFQDHAGDMFCPVANPSFENAEELKRQERKERARMNKQGTWFHELIVEGEEVTSCGGFVGNDFYNSGCDSDFYREAITMIKDKYPDYIDGMHLGDFMDF